MILCVFFLCCPFLFSTVCITTIVFILLLRSSWIRGVPIDHTIDIDFDQIDTHFIRRSIDSSIIIHYTNYLHTTTYTHDRCTIHTGSTIDRYPQIDNHFSLVNKKSNRPKTTVAPNMIGNKQILPTVFTLEFLAYTDMNNDLVSSDISFFIVYSYRGKRALFMAL